MHKQGKRFAKLGVTLLTVLAGGLFPTALAGAAGAEENPNDNLVKTVTYFPMPYVTYNTIYIGKKLDIGISQGFLVELGDPECDGKNLLKTTLPSLWLPGEEETGSATTPLLLRSHMPDGTNFAGRLDISGLSSPLYVKEVEVGQRDREGIIGTSNLKLKALHENMGNVSVLVPNLAFGNSAVSPNALNSLTVYDNTDVTVTVKDGTRTVGFPRCTDGSAHWDEVNFNGTKKAMVCGDLTKTPFPTDYSCYNGPTLRCELDSSNNFYCDISGCTDYYRWNLKATYPKTMTAAMHKEYCTWLKTGEFSETVKAEKLRDLIMGDSWKSRSCGDEAPNTDWETTVPTLSYCYFITSSPAAGDVTCLEPTEENPDPNNTALPDVKVTYGYYDNEQYSYQDCADTCSSYN